MTREYGNIMIVKTGESPAFGGEAEADEGMDI